MIAMLLDVRQVQSTDRGNWATPAVLSGVVERRPELLWAGVSVVLHAIRHIKLRIFAQDGVANPHNSGTIAVVCALP
jgi:hypothetical protein